MNRPKTPLSKEMSSCGGSKAEEEEEEEGEEGEEEEAAKRDHKQTKWRKTIKWEIGRFKTEKRHVT